MIDYIPILTISTTVIACAIIYKIMVGFYKWGYYNSAYKRWTKKQIKLDFLIMDEIENENKTTEELEALIGEARDNYERKPKWNERRTP